MTHDELMCLSAHEDSVRDFSHQISHLVSALPTNDVSLVNACLCLSSCISVMWALPTSPTTGRITVSSKGVRYLLTWLHLCIVDS